MSVAVTFMFNTPTFSFKGVPENVLVDGLKLNHAGIAVLSLNVAE